jgi:cation diffusion facilitator CzcD-associated flavoprotein CzcO
MDYSYSFSDELQQEWHWTERYASQPEILRYINHVADRFDLCRDIQLSTRVTEAVFDEDTARWTIRTDRGDEVSAGFCVMATGCLSEPQLPPPFPGIEAFEGSWYHTGRWPHEGVDFTGQRVAVIGTGSSAIQSIPLIAKQAKHLTVFQRTPNYSIPAHNAPLDPEYERQVKASYIDFRQAARQSRIGFAVPVTETPALSVSAEEREREYQARWQRGGLDRRLVADQPSRPRRHRLTRQVARRAAHVSRARRRRLPERVHDHRPGQPVGVEQHDRLDRAARRLDRRLHRRSGGAWRQDHRSHAGGGGGLGRACQRGRQ